MKLELREAENNLCTGVVMRKGRLSWCMGPTVRVSGAVSNCAGSQWSLIQGLDRKMRGQWV
jgi:hypothetical protein